MTILSGIPVLNCRSIEQTLAFYQQLLQFVVVNKREINGDLFWVHIMHGDTTLMLQTADEQQKTDLSQSQKSNITLYFYVNNIKELHHYVKAKHRDVSEVYQTDYRVDEFSMVDPEGNTVIAGMAVVRKPDC